MILSGTVGVYDLGSGAVIAGQLGSGAVQTQNIASGAINQFKLSSGCVVSGDIGNAAVVSGSIASGSVSQFALSSGAVNSGQLNTTGTPSATTFLRGDLVWATPPGGVNSGDIGSGKIASGAVQGFFGTVRNIASGTVGVFDFGSGAVIAGAVGSGAIQSQNIASGAVGQFALSSGAVNSGDINDGAVVSGSIASGQITLYHIASGQHVAGSGNEVQYNINAGFAADSGFTYLGSGGIRQLMVPTVFIYNTFGLATRYISGNATLSAPNSGQTIILADATKGNMTITLPDPTNMPGQVYIVKKIDATTNQVGVRAPGIQPLEGSISTIFMTVPNQWMGVVADFNTNSGWWIIDQSPAGATLSSGSVGSGIVASGTVPGFFGPYRGIMSGTVGVFDFGSGAVIAGTVGSGAIQSGNIASGQIAQFHLASGAVNSGQINTTGTPSTSVFLRGDFAWAAAGGGLASGAVGSGFLASGSVQGFFGATRDIASGTVGVFDFGSGAVIAGTVGSGAIQSGNIASGDIGSYHLSSGDIIDIAQYGALYTSGLQRVSPAVITKETISGGRAVSIDASGHLQIAMASIPSRMPAVGVVVDNVLSGIQVNAYTFGSFLLTSGMIEWSGNYGAQAYVGRSGQIVSWSGAWWNSGGFLSGDYFQVVGTLAGSGLVAVGLNAPNAFPIGVGDPTFIVTSGFIASGAVGPFALANNAVQSGNIASGAVSQFKLASGAVNSGQVGSGAIMGEAGGGAFNIASGTINNFDIAAAGVLSGNIASGQIAQFHLASGAVNSGQINTTGTPSTSVFLRGDFSWATPAGGGLVSGSVQSGHIASGAVQGFFGSTRNIASGTVGAFDFGSGAVMAGQMGSGAVQSGNVGSGQLGAPEHFSSGGIIDRARYVVPFQSGYTRIGSGGAVTEENISGIRAVCMQVSGYLRVAMAGTSGRMPAVGIVMDNIASGGECTVFTDGVFQATSGLADYSGYLGQTLFVGRSGNIVTSSGSFNSGGLLSGDIWQPIGTVVRTSGYFKVSVAAQMAFQVGLVTSGLIASGQIWTYHVASGAVFPRAQEVCPTYSGTFSTQTAEELISGVRAVQVSYSGNIRIAMASIPTRMPAVGIVFDNISSGQVANVFTMGFRAAFAIASGVVDYSGYVGRPVFVGRSGQITNASGSFSSGLFLSGDQGQLVGIAANSGAFYYNVFPIAYSGGPAAIGGLGTASQG
jgi:hypothetical protein